MSGQNIRIRKNGLTELRFCHQGKRYSVYGRTLEECQQKKALKMTELQSSAAALQNENTIYFACLQFCDAAMKCGTVHEEGYKSLVKTARFIGRSVIANTDIKNLDDQLIEVFRSSVNQYAENTVKKAIYMLINIKKEAF